MIKHSAIKDGRGQPRQFDPRDANHVDELLVALLHRDVSVYRDILAQIDAMPQYAQNWEGTKRIVREMQGRFALRSAS